MEELIYRDKLIEEIQEEIEAGNDSDPVDSLVNKGLVIALHDIKAQPTIVNRWIPCSERTPSNMIWVLCAGRDGMGIFRYTGATWLDENGLAYSTNEITHWMPLPEPPKDGDCE